VERRTAPHLQRLARVVGEHVDRRVVRRVLAPPSPPGLVPRPVAAAEHPAAHDDRADAPLHLVRDLGVHIALAAGQAVLLAPGTGGDGPLVQAHPALAERVVKALVGSGDEAVERHRQLTGNRGHA
jgi:hypothetical protein